MLQFIELNYEPEESKSKPLTNMKTHPLLLILRIFLNIGESVKVIVFLVIYETALEFSR